jgi:hypothetical protein
MIAINDFLFGKRKIRSMYDEIEEDMKQNINIRVCLVWK